MTTIDRIKLEDLKIRLFQISLDAASWNDNKSDKEKQDIFAVEHCVWAARHMLQNMIDEAKIKQAEMDSLDQCTEQEIADCRHEKVGYCPACRGECKGGSKDVHVPAMSDASPG